MARSWLMCVAILASLVAGAVGSTFLCGTALADNKFSGGGMRVSGNSSPGGSVSRSSAVPRSGGNFSSPGSSGFRPPVSRVPSNVGGSLGTQAPGKIGGNVLTRPPVSVTPKPPVAVTPKLPVGSNLPIVGGVGGAIGGAKINPTPIVGGKTGGVLKAPIGNVLDKGGGLNIKPIVAGKVGGITLGPKAPVVDPKGPILGSKTAGIVAGGCFPGGNPHCTPCNPFKPGCHPWWFCPSWVAPAIAPCYPVVYTEPIIIPVSVPAAPIFVPVPVEQTPAAPSDPATAQPTEAAKPAPATPEEKLLQVPLGATLTLQAKELGEQAGQVIVQIEKIAMPALVSDWTTDSVTATLPTVAIAENLRAELLLVKADGQVASSVKVELTPALPPVAEDAKLAGDPAAATSLLPSALNP